MSKLVTYYNDAYFKLSDAVDLPYTEVILSFLYTTPDAPATVILDGGIAASSNPPELTQTTIDSIAALQRAGKKVRISFGGGAMTSAAYKGMVGQEDAIAQSISAFIKKYGLDGIDIDFEDTQAFMDGASYDGVALLVNLTKALRAELPARQYTITHAPQPPYLVDGLGMDGYGKIMEQIGGIIDALNVQFYNNPPYSGTTESVVEYYEQFSKLPGLSPEKLLIGLPVTTSDAGSGYIPIDEIVSGIIDPIQENGVLGGMMNWQFYSDYKNGADWSTTIGKALNLDNES